MFKKSFGTVKHIYFIGIGGIGMSAIAKIILAMGYQVSGSDLTKNETIEEFLSSNIKIYLGHRRTNISNHIDVVVTSSAISPANPEVLEAKDKKIPIIQRGEMLAEIMRLKQGIAIAGTHGKTTTTSLVSAIFNHAGYSPTSVIGGKWFGINSNAELGKSNILICESDESDGSFLKLSPIICVVTNIDCDHMDYYLNEERLLLSFLEFINKTPFYGKAFLCFENENLYKLKPEIEKPFTSYGFNENFNIFAKNIISSGLKSNFSVVVNGKDLGNFQLNIAGKHNVLNSLAAIGVALEAGIPLDKIKEALLLFKGVDRRMSCLGKWNNLIVMDDYGHHPSEVEATLLALKENTKNNKLICVFQPHRYTRTLEHYKGFAQSLCLADKIYLTEIYAAGENSINEVSSSMILEEINKINPKKIVKYIKDRNQLKEIICQENQEENGILLTMGAGNIYHLAKELVKNDL